MVFSISLKKMPHKAVYSQPNYTMNILAAHLNINSATEMLYTIL